MGKHLIGLMVLLALVVGMVVAAGAVAFGGPISVPDSDTFSVAGTPPPGWSGGNWVGDGSVVVPEYSVYSVTSIRRTASDYYVLDHTKPLVISWDMLPALGGEASNCGISFVNAAYGRGYGANYAIGYYLTMNNGGTLSLCGDNLLWDGGQYTLGSSSGGSNSQLRNYRIEVRETGGTTANFKVYVNYTGSGDVPKIDVNDANYLPYTNGDQPGTYDNMAVYLCYQSWPTPGSNRQYDNYQLFFVQPPPPEPPVPEPSGLGLLGLALLGLRKRRS